MNWPISLTSITSLSLDQLNVRLREGRGSDMPGQPEGQDAADVAILRYMLEVEDLLSLVRDILRDGYIDNEVPVVAMEGSSLVVLEGNRRVSALKVIHAPHLAGSYADRLQRLLERYQDATPPEEIRVMQAPDRSTAQPLLARLHTGQSKRPWGRDQQAIFFHAQLDQGLTVDDLRAAYPREARNLPRFIKMGEMRQLLGRLTYEEQGLRDYALHGDLKMSVFEYAYRPKRLERALGLIFSTDGLLQRVDPSPGQAAALQYLLRRFRAGTLNTRSAELFAKNGAQHEAFARALESRVRDVESPETAASTAPLQPTLDWASTSAEFNATDDVSAVARNDEPWANGQQTTPIAGSAVADTEVEQFDSARRDDAPVGSREARARPISRVDKMARLDMGGFQYVGPSGGLRRRFEELASISVDRFPNAAYDLLRTVLECSIKEHLRSHSGSQLRPDAMLRECVNELGRLYAQDAKLTKHLNAIKRRGSLPAEQYGATSQALNESNHEPDSFADREQVHWAWDRIKPILQSLPTPSSPS